MAELDRATQIRRSMAYIRSELNEDVEGVFRNARTLTDWHYYIRNYPWVSVGLAAVVGYWVVPRKVEIQSPDEETVEKLAKKHKLVINNSPEPKTKPGPIGAAFSFVSGLVFKAAMAQLGHQLASMFDQRRQPQSGNEPTSSPAGSTARRPE